MNSILQQSVSAVSPKVNTTRDGVRGVRTVGDTQLVFLDVPGIIPSHQRLAVKELTSKAWRGYRESDIVLLVIDVVKRPTQEVFDVVRRVCPRENIGEFEVRQRVRAAEEAGEHLPPSWLPSLALDDLQGASSVVDAGGLPARPGGHDTHLLNDEFDDLEEEMPDHVSPAKEHRPPVTLVLNKIDKAEEFRWVQNREQDEREREREREREQKKEIER